MSALDQSAGLDEIRYRLTRVTRGNPRTQGEAVRELGHRPIKSNTEKRLIGRLGVVDERALGSHQKGSAADSHFRASVIGDNAKRVDRRGVKGTQPRMLSQPFLNDPHSAIDRRNPLEKLT